MLQWDHIGAAYKGQIALSATSKCSHYSVSLNHHKWCHPMYIWFCVIKHSIWLLSIFEIHRCEVGMVCTKTVFHFSINILWDATINNLLNDRICKIITGYLPILTLFIPAFSNYSSYLYLPYYLILELENWQTY